MLGPADARPDLRKPQRTAGRRRRPRRRAADGARGGGLRQDPRGDAPHRAIAARRRAARPDPGADLHQQGRRGDGPPGARTGRRLRARGDRHPGEPSGRCRLQHRRRAGRGAQGPRGECRSGGVPRADAVLLCDRRSAAPARADRAGRAGAGRGGGGLGRPPSGAGAGRAAQAGGQALQLRGGDRGRADPRRCAQELPAQLPRVLREAPLRPRAGLHRSVDRSGGRGSAVRHRSGVRRGQPPRFPLRGGDLRGFLGAGAAGDAGRDGGRADPVQPVRLTGDDRARR